MQLKHYNLDLSEATQKGHTPAKIVKENAQLFAHSFYTSFNNCIQSDVSTSCLKNADISPIYKKGSKNSSYNYRPVSILPNNSKICERPLFCQLLSFLIKSFPFISADLKKGLVSNIAQLMCYKNGEFVMIKINPLVH